MASFTVTYSLAHVESEVDVLFLGEEQNEEVITRLTLLDGWIQTDLLRQYQREKECEKINNKGGKLLFGVQKKSDRKGIKVLLTTKNICL